jgi:hypothetical protein
VTTGVVVVTGGKCAAAWLLVRRKPTVREFSEKIEMSIRELTVAGGNKSEVKNL